MKVFLQLWLVVFMSYALAAQAVSIGHTDSLELTGRLFQANGEPPPATIAGLSSWISTLHEVKRVSLLGGSYWFFAEAGNDSGTPEWVLEPGNRLIEKIDARIYAKDDPVQHFTSGYLADHDYMLHYGKRIKLTDSSAILVRFESPYYPSMPKVRLYTPAAYHHLVLLENSEVLAALGALIALALYNFFIGFMTHDRALFYYAIYLVDYFLGWAFTFQLPAELFGWHNLQLHYIWFFLLPVLGTLFYTEFLELKSNFPKLAVISRVNLILPLILLPSCFFALPYAHLLATAVISLWIAIALVCGISSHLSGFRPARYFIAAFFFLLIPGVIILPANFGLMPELMRSSEIVTLMGGTLEGILLAFALAYKIRLLSDEKAQARQQALIHAQENETLESNIKERNEQNALLKEMNCKLESAQTLLRTSEARLHAILDNSPISIWMLGISGQYHFVNKTFCNALGISERAFLEASHIEEVMDPLAAACCMQSDRRCLAQDMPHFSQETLTFVDGKPHLLEITKVKSYDDSGNITGIIGVGIDITERKIAEDEIKSLAFYDPLTLLPNRRLLLDRLKSALSSSVRNEQAGALLFIDLDNFKSLNDTLGHDMGDYLLQQVAQRLATCVREGDTVSRFGGDEFVVMLEELSKNMIEAAAQTEFVGEKILAALNLPYPLISGEYLSTPSIGATLFYGNNQSTDELMKQADIAMYQSKKAGRNTLRFFDPVMQESVMSYVALENDLRQAVAEQQQFQLYYQPQVDYSGHVVGAEALLRWISPERGIVSPGIFIPLAEESGLILSLGRWVMSTACTQLATWAKRTETAHLTLAVNVSARQFRMPVFVEEVLTLVEQSGINPAKLKLEITESMLLDNVDDIIAKMTELKKRGLNFSMDDFGTGYSSLQYLKRLPLDQLKIDQSFVHDIGNDLDGATIIQTIIAMANNLGMDVIAEGVETLAQKDFLVKHGCLHFQGYLFGRPVPRDDFDKMIAPKTPF
jgi:diguanylate cyclase (GGDEF)-like protein/PAS domain S-box-containing protein